DPRVPQANRRDGELDGDLRSIASQGAELEASVENRALATLQEVLQAAPVGLPMSGRHDDVGDVPTDNLVRRPPEHGLRLSIPGHDGATVVHGDVGVER